MKDSWRLLHATLTWDEKKEVEIAKLSGNLWLKQHGWWFWYLLSLVCYILSPNVVDTHPDRKIGLHESLNKEGLSVCIENQHLKSILDFAYEWGLSTGEICNCLIFQADWNDEKSKLNNSGNKNNNSSLKLRH